MGLSKLSKEELSEEIMDFLGLAELESLTRMTRADLIKLYEAVQGLKNASIGVALFDKPLGEILDQKIGGKPVRELTLGEIVATIRREGPLGLGILPEVKREIRRLIRGERKT